MKLFYDFSELKACIGFANINNDLASIEPYVDMAIGEILLPIVGGDLLAALDAKGEDNSFAEGFETDAWKLMQKAAANQAYYLWASDGTLNIDDYGMRQIDDGQSKSAYQWQVREFKEARLLRAYQELYLLAKLLWKQQDETWLADSDRLQIEKMLLWKMEDWKQVRSLYSWYSFLSIVGHVSYVLDKKIVPLIGQAKYTVLLAEVAAPDAETGANAPLLKGIRQALAHFSIIEAAQEINFKLTINGLQVIEIDSIASNDRKVRSLNAAEKESLITHATKRGNEAMCVIDTIINPPAAVVADDTDTEPQTNVMFLG